MKKTFFLVALCAMTLVAMAETRVETFDPVQGDPEQNNKTYNTSPYSYRYQQATWTTCFGGISKNQGKMGADNYVAICRALKTGETGSSFIESDSIDGGIDSLSFVWNSNGDSNCDLDINIYINDQKIGGIYHIDEYIGEGGPFYTWSIGKLKVEGKFVIRVVNTTPYEGTSNKKRFVMDNLTWETYTASPSTDVESVQAEAQVVNVYRLDGSCVKAQVAEKNATEGLDAGVYIINNKKVVITH